MIAEFGPYVLDLQHVVCCRDIGEKCRDHEGRPDKVEEFGGKRASCPMLQVCPSHY